MQYLFTGSSNNKFSKTIYVYIEKYNDFALVAVVTLLALITLPALATLTAVVTSSMTWTSM